MIQTTSLIVTLSISQWSARKLDRKITDEVNRDHNASDDAGRFNKLLLDKKYTEPLQKITTRARDFHYDNTLAWGDNGERLLSAANYFDYVAKINKFNAEYSEAVVDFLGNYDMAIEERKKDLNGMFNPKDYPTREEVKNKFDFKVTFMPVPDTDFRVTLSDDEVARLKESVGIEINNRLADAVKEVWERIGTQLTKMKEKLSDSEAIFRNSLFENLNELLTLLPKLNVTNDVNIAKVCVAMKALVADPEAIRNDERLRAQKAQDVESVLSKFGSFFS